MVFESKSLMIWKALYCSAVMPCSYVTALNKTFECMTIAFDYIVCMTFAYIVCMTFDYMMTFDYILNVWPLPLILN